MEGSMTFSARARAVLARSFLKSSLNMAVPEQQKKRKCNGTSITPLALVGRSNQPAPSA
jgi:hypothetical protein